MRILVCGSRHFRDWKLLWNTLDELPGDCVFIHGDARGADTGCDIYGTLRGHQVIRFPADWNKHGKGAGPIRNKQMLDEGKPDLVIAFMFKDSRGTKNMVEQAKKAGVETKVINCI